MNAVALAALSKATSSEPWRDELAEGTQHTCILQIAGKVNGRAIAPYEIKSTVTIGHDSMRNSSTGPNQGHLIATILSKLNDATRNAILRDLPAAYAARCTALRPSTSAFMVTLGLDIVPDLPAMTFLPADEAGFGMAIFYQEFVAQFS